MHKKTVIDFKEKGRRLIFTNPIKELKTKNIEQVLPLIEQVESYQRQGYYVVGYLAYEAAPAFEKKLEVAAAPLQTEYLLYFTVHESYEETDFPLDYEDVAMPANWQSRVDQEAYHQAIDAIHSYIKNGDTYQVNYTIQLEAEMDADPWLVYNRLMVEQEASYNAFIQTDDFAVLSISPELFFQKTGQQLKTRPMKGTTKRQPSLLEDQAAAAWLAADPKNRAENMMIVDLLRNDMNRICKIGSVRVDKLCSVEQYSTVWQMTSTILGDLADHVGLVDLLTALFPCGSITGAPKMSTMHFIKELEKFPRGVYCGTIGLLEPNGHMLFNVPIRTLQIAGKHAIYGVGGGITWDSSWQGEYEEVAQKAAILKQKRPRFDLLTTGKVEKRELLYRSAHLKRLVQTAAYFAFPFDRASFDQDLEAYLAHLDEEQDYRLRISLSKAGSWTFEASPYQELTDEQRTLQLKESRLPLSPYHFFKTSFRPHLEQGSYLYYNKEGFLMETGIANLLLEKDGQLYTPKKEVGILQGIYLQGLLKEGKVQEKDLYIKDLEEADNLYSCNSLRGIFPIKIKK